MKNWFYSLTKGKQIAMIVLFAHSTLLISLMIDHWTRAPSLKKNKVIVNTVIINNPPPQKPKTVQSKPTSSQPKKQVAKAAPTKPKSPSPQKTILQQIESSLESISSPTIPKKQEISVPIFYDPPPIDTIEDPEAPSASQQIAVYLQESLQLPEFGEVKVFLSIDRFGRLISVEVLESKSAKNAEFLKNRLPELQFPWLNEAISLTIMFSNAL